MAVTDQQFLDHADLNNAEFANRQVTIRGDLDPRQAPGYPGIMGWFYLSENVTPHARYEKVGPLDTDWETFTAGSDGSTGGSTPSSPVPVTSLYLNNSDITLSASVRHIVPMSTPTVPTYDSNGDWDLINNRLEAPAAGIYTVTVHVEYEDTDSIFEKFIYLRSTGNHGHTVPGSSISSEGENTLVATAIFKLDAGDFVYLESEHYSPVTVDLLSTSIHCISNPPLPDHEHDERYYTQGEVDAIIDGILGGNKVLGVEPVEAPNGAIDTFTLPSGDSFLEGTLEMHVNGLYEGQPVRVSATQFQVSQPYLEPGDELRCSYIVDLRGRAKPS